MKRFRIDCYNVHTFADFVEVANVGLIRQVDGEWHGNLDAFNDYFSWPDEEEYELELIGAAHCAHALAYEEMAKWLRQTLFTCHPSGRPQITERLSLAERCVGETLFDLLLDIIHTNKHVHLILS